MNLPLWSLAWMPHKYVGQRDKRWSWQKVGTGGYSIGQVGCTITCIANLLGVTPDYVNNMMKSKGGYKYGNLVNWAMLPKVFPDRIASAYRYYSYDNAIALKAIERNKFLLVEVDGRPIGAPGGKHWIGFKGNKQAHDPWYNIITPTSSWTITGMAVIHLK